MWININRVMGMMWATDITHIWWIHPSLVPIRAGHVSPPKEDTCHRLTLATCQLLNRARLANRVGDVSGTPEV